MSSPAIFCGLRGTTAILLILLTFVTNVQGATPDQWRGRSIYQLLTDRYARTDLSTSASCPPGFEGYCGGTFKGIASQLDYIQSMGFDAIWISPVVQQVSDPARGYIGYTAVNLYELNDNFGTPDDLEALSASLHERGMFLMVDVVPNHFGYDGNAKTVDYSTFYPFSSDEYFHSPDCWVSLDSSQTDLQVCWLGNNAYPLPDVDTTRDDIREMYGSWIKTLVANYSIDGLRIDSVKNVEKSFWPGFNEAAGVYVVGEVSNGDVDYACDYQNYMDGILNYPGYYALIKFFTNTTTSAQSLINETNALHYTCKDPTILSPFSENHDLPRFANLTTDMALASNAIAFTLLGDGIPIIYSGQEHHLGGPDDRQATWLSAYDTSAPLAQLITTLNKLRKQAISATGSNYTMDLSRVIYYDDHTIAMRKGASGSQIVALYANLGSLAAPFSLDLMTEGTGFAASEAVMEILTCAAGTVDSNGALYATITSGQPLVYFPASAIAGSGLCGSSASDALHSNTRRSGLVALLAIFPILWLSEFFA